MMEKERKQWTEERKHYEHFLDEIQKQSMKQS